MWTASPGDVGKLPHCGFTQAKAPLAFENGWIAKEAPGSRPRRAISWVTCEPKSTMRTKSWLMPPHVAQRAAGCNGGQAQPGFSQAFARERPRRPKTPQPPPLAPPTSRRGPPPQTHHLGVPPYV